MATSDYIKRFDRSALNDVLRIIFGTLARAVGTLLAAALIFLAGISSSRYMVDRGSRLSTSTFGPWTHWRMSGRADADPYTRAHVAKSGAIYLSADAAGQYEARADGQGARLHSSCDYVIEGPNANGLWWSLSVFDDRGELINNDAARYTFTSDTIAANPDGSYIVTLGRDARPGNWLPTGGAGRLQLMFTILDPATGLSQAARSERYKLLPLIRREGCS